MSKSGLLVAVIMMVLLAGDVVYACRVVDPRPDKELEKPAPVREVVTKKHKVDVEITEGVAKVRVEAVFHNPNRFAVTGTYFFPLPERVAVKEFKIRIGEKEIVAELMEASEAKKLFIEAARRQKNPALLEYADYRIIKASVANIAPGGEVTVKLSYAQELPYSGGMSEFLYPLSSARNTDGTLIEKVSIKVRITSQVPVRGVYSPDYPFKLERKSEKEVLAVYEGAGVNPNKDLTLFVERSNEDVGLLFLPFKEDENEAGYFMLMFTPKLEWEGKVMPKDIVFVLDVSGSMRGRKIEQAKKALVFCVNALNPKDRFEVITFSNGVSKHFGKLVDANKGNIADASGFIKSIAANGGTNINQALLDGLAMFNENERPKFIIFLTDGQPTQGVRDVRKIIENVSSANKGGVRLFVFGVGYNVNTLLLDKLAEENNGSREYVKEKESIELKVSNLYSKIANPILSNISIEYSFKVEDAYPVKFNDLFRGGQLTLFGRYEGSGEQSITLKGISAGEKKSYEYKVKLVSESRYDFVPRLWAMRKIGYLLDHIRLYGEKKELRDAVIELSKKYGIATPYTSFAGVPAEDAGKVAGRWQRGGGLKKDEKGLGGRHRGERSKSAPASGAPPAPLAEPKKPQARPVGKQAVKESEKLKKLRDASELKEEAEGRSELGFKVIGPKKFQLRADGFWVDTEFNPEKFKEKDIIKIKFMSNEYFELIEKMKKKHKDILKYLSLGEKIIIILDGKAYKIGG